MAPNPTLPAKRTVGEELFLVHLSRQDPEDIVTDKDGVFPQRKRSKSIGEELFDVHLKRVAGVDPDYDEPTKKPEAKKTTKKKQASPSAHVIHLRNRDVPPPSMTAH